MPALLIRTTENSKTEYVMIEVQGDLEYRDPSKRDEMNNNGKFIGDLLYNKFGSPILIIGHHILHGKEKKLDKPFALIQKVPKTKDNEDEEEEDVVNHVFDQTVISQQPNMSISVLDSTVNVENRTKPQVEYTVIALIKKKLVFSQRPRPIISNVPKCI